MTVLQAAKRLGIHPAKFGHRVGDGTVLLHTDIDEHSPRFFDEAWLEKTEAVIENSFENQVRRQTEG